VLSGTLVAVLVTLTDIRGRGALVLCYVMPLIIAPQVTALAWLQLFGPASPFLKLFGAAPPLGTKNPLYSTSGIILLLGVQYGPLVFLLVRAGLRKLPRELVEAARAGGAGWFTVLVTIVLPLMTPSIMAAAALAFVSCIGNFGIPAFLGIPANYLVLPTLIYQRLAGGGPAVLGETAFLSVLIGVIVMMLDLLGGFGEKGRTSLAVSSGNDRILLDIGIKVGASGAEYYPALDGSIAEINALFVSHAHEDHVGALSWLLSRGYAGPIFMTAETRDEAPATLAGYADPGDLKQFPFQKIASSCSSPATR
jgi:ABC-type spermidine/putrescine transport system permease subunit I